MTIEIDVTNYRGRPCASFTLPRNRMSTLTIYVGDGDVIVDGLGEQSSLCIPLDTMRAAISAHDTAALWADVEDGWERTDASGCAWKIRTTLLFSEPGHRYTGSAYAVWRNDGDGFVQVGESYPTWGKAMLAAEGMVAR